MLDFENDSFEKLAENEQTVGKAAQIIENAYWQCLNYLGVTKENHNNQVNADPEMSTSQSYNVWMTPRMIFVVAREKPSVKGPLEFLECSERPQVDINTLGFAGTIAVKN